MSLVSRAFVQPGYKKKGGERQKTCGKRGDASYFVVRNASSMPLYVLRFPPNSKKTEKKSWYNHVECSTGASGAVLSQALECFEPVEKKPWPDSAPISADIAEKEPKATRILLQQKGGGHNTFFIKKSGRNRAGRGTGYIVLHNNPVPVTTSVASPAASPEAASPEAASSSGDTPTPLRHCVRIALPSTDSVSVEYLQAYAARMAASQKRVSRDYLRELDHVVLRGTYHRVLLIANSLRLSCLYNSRDRVWRRLVVDPHNTMLVGGCVALDLHSCLTR